MAPPSCGSHAPRAMATVAKPVFGDRIPGRLSRCTPSTWIVAGRSFRCICRDRMEVVGRQRFAGFAPGLKNRGLRGRAARGRRVLDLWTFGRGGGGPHENDPKVAGQESPLRAVGAGERETIEAACALLAKDFWLLRETSIDPKVRRTDALRDRRAPPNDGRRREVG